MLEIKYGNPGQQEEMELPKNIRQIGTPGQKHKVYIEDYVYTYVHQFLAGGESTELRAAVLLGKCVCKRDRVYTFVSGAVACEPEFWQENAGSKEEDKARLYQTIKTYFSELDILGWYLYEPGSELQIRDEIQDFYLRNRGRGTGLLYYADPTMAMEQVFMLEQDKLQDVGGFYIFYEKNPQMQEYMVSVKEDEKREKKSFLFWKNELEEDYFGEEEQKSGSEPAEQVKEEKQPKQMKRLKDDKTKQHIQKQIIQTRKQINREQRGKNTTDGKTNRNALVYAACVALLVLVSAVGITQISNYQSMKSLEQAIQVLSGAVDNTKDMPSAGMLMNETQSTDETVSAPPERPDSDVETGVSGTDTGLDTEADSGNEADLNATEPTENETGEEKTTETSAEVADYLDQGYYIVQQGDSIAKISKKIYNSLDMVDAICEKNGIQKTDLIFAGQKIELP